VHTIAVGLIAQSTVAGTSIIVVEILTLSLTSLTVFTQRNFVADFLQAKCDFTRKTAVLSF